MKRALLTYGWLLCALLTYAQQAQLVPDVIASAGTTVSAGGANLSFTVGETAVTTLTATGVSFGQGFHNGVIDIVDGVAELELADWKLKVYPNPASQAVYVEFEAPQPGATLDAMLWDMQGRQLMEARPLLGNANDPIEVHNLSNGTYLLRLTDQIGRAAFVKIVKAQ